MNFNSQRGKQWDECSIFFILRIVEEYPGNRSTVYPQQNSVPEVFQGINVKIIVLLWTLLMVNIPMHGETQYKGEAKWISLCRKHESYDGFRWTNRPGRPIASPFSTMLEIQGNYSHEKYIYWSINLFIYILLRKSWENRPFLIL